MHEAAIPKARPRFGNGRVYTDPRTEAWEAYVGLQGRQINPAGLLSLAPIAIDIHLLNPAGGDADNHVKALLDGLNGVLYRDDGQVATIHAAVYRDRHLQPLTYVKVTELAPPPSLPPEIAALAHSKPHGPRRRAAGR